METVKQDVTNIVGKDAFVWPSNVKVLIPAKIPLEEALPILQRHERFLGAFTDTLPVNECLVITSTSVDYQGNRRTMSNGKNHVINKGLDFIVVERQQIQTEERFFTQRSFPYSRSVLVIMIVAMAVGRGYVGRVCLEDDHVHVHDAPSFTGVLQMVKGKNHYNGNSSFLCQVKGASHLHIDITSFVRLIIASQK